MTGLQHDVRSPEHYNSRLVGHRSEVCGLKWSPDGRELASGGNDNQLFIWNNSSLSPRLRFVEHTAAVKAIAWSPHQHGLLGANGPAPLVWAHVHVGVKQVVHLLRGDG